MLLPDPAEEPVIPPVTAGSAQLKVVPVTVLCSEIPVLLPLQMLCVAGLPLPTGIGLTVITTDTGVPGHRPGAGPVGVIV